MLSRVADSLFWMARYIERAEHTARLIDVQLNLMLDQSGLSADERWGRILASLGHPLPADAPQSAEELTRLMLTEGSSPASIVSSLMQARENARQIREQISSEMWEQINRLYHEVRRDPEERAEGQEFLAGVVRGIHLFQGITDSTMSHGQGWRFIQIGRSLERAISTALLIQVHYRDFGAHGIDRAPLEWVGLLKSLTAFEAYCHVYTADLQPARIAEFLILNADFPHSVRFAVDQLAAGLHALPESDGRETQVSRLAGRLRASLSFASIDEMMSAGIGHYLAEIESQCLQIHNGIHNAYMEYPIETALSA
jgi:uncharacterized alpha-E superfamily protein